jgi:hypothetical protein
MPSRTLQASKTRSIPLVIASVLLLFPTVARADAGIPMLPVAYPVILLFLIPVVAIETIYIRQRLRTRWRNTIAATAGANLVTMLLGFPLVWIFLVALQFLSTDFLDRTHSAALITVLTAPWPVPAYGDPWAVPVAFVLLLVPAFLLSAFVEGLLLNSFHWLHSDRPSTRTVWMANVFSYVFLAAVGFIILWLLIRHEHALHPLFRS